MSRALYRPAYNLHTSIKPYRLDQIEAYLNTDSLIFRDLKRPQEPMNIWKRIIHDDIFKWEFKGDEPITIAVNPYFNFELGKEQEEGKNIWVNTRGLTLEGKLGKKLAFYSAIYENQAVFPQYIDEFIDTRGVVPGQGRAKTFGDNGWDYSQSSGYLSYNAGKWVNMTLGYGKNFIGDGYRSLLLSDNSYSYPYVKMTTTFLKVQYMVMLGQFSHIDKLERAGDERFPYKYGAFHYLNWNIGKRLSLGFFESVIWAAQDTTGYRGVDLGYLIPVIIYRPVEYSVGSPDNVVIGLNLKYIPWKDAAFYGQFVMNEFKLDEIMSGEKWWANKQGFQVGFKNYNFLGLKNLDLQTEYSQVRPFTYSHYQPITNFGHFNQELAHPLGANYRESISFLSYRWNRGYLHLEAMYAIHGKDYYDSSRPADDQISWGGDIFVSNMKRYDSHGHEIAQGLETTIKHAAASVSFLVNPKSNMNISAGIRLRDSNSVLENKQNVIFHFAFRTSLRNFYYNF
ncbi:MAG TPA: hypothetical protein DDW62_04455 [Marinilabiliaceae bacterium]|nr:hypothetical protein [Marinilabiliaceae bacterium]